MPYMKSIKSCRSTYFTAFLGSNVLMLALPVLFERSGKFTADFTLKDNGINDVLLNEESMMTIAPVSLFFVDVIVFNHKESLF